jgi:3-oxoadipate enol-lactonase
VTLAHGLATDLSMWDELTAALTPNYRVLRYDARGHGGSGVSNGDYSWDLLVSDIKCILDHLGIDKTHFVVLSMGGMIGLGLALDHPLRLKSLAACDARAVATPKYNEGWTERMRIVRTGGMETLVERTLKRWFTPAFLTRPSAALDKMRAMMSATSRDGYCGCAAALQTLDFQRRLGEIRLPTLYSGPRCAARGNSHHAHRTPGSHYVEIPDAHLGGGTTRPIPRGHLQFHRQCRGSKPVTDIVHNLPEGEWPWSTTTVCSG